MMSILIGDKFICLIGSKSRRGEDFLLALNSKSEVLGMGSNDKTQLGTRYIRLIDRFSKLNVPAHPIIRIAAGYEHTLLLDDNGQVFGVGSNDKKQLGRTSFTYRFVQISVPVKIIDIVAESDFSMMLDVDGNVWICGFSNEQVRKITHNIKIIQMAAGHSHYLLLDDNGKVWSGGSSEHDQLGYISPNTSVDMPRLIDIDAKCVKVAAGDHHSVVLDAHGRLWVFGSNSHEQLGYDKNIKLSNIINYHDVCAIDVFAGFNQTVFIDRSDRLWIAGSDRYLGLPTSNKLPFFNEISTTMIDGNIIDVAIGDKFLVYITLRKILTIMGKMSDIHFRGFSRNIDNLYP